MGIRKIISDNVAESRIRSTGKMKRFKAKVTSLTPKTALDGFLRAVKKYWMPFLLFLIPSIIIYNAFFLISFALRAFEDVPGFPNIIAHDRVGGWLLMLCALAVIYFVLGVACFFVRSIVSVVFMAIRRVVSFFMSPKGDKVPGYMVLVEVIPVSLIMIVLTSPIAWEITEWVFLRGVSLPDTTNYFYSDNVVGKIIMFVNLIIIMNVPRNVRSNKNYAGDDDEDEDPERNRKRISK